MTGTPDPEAISTRLNKIATMAREMPQEALRTLAHHIDEDLLHEAYRRTRKDGATGVDGQTAEQYAQQLSDRLRDLHERFKSGRYRAPPVRRVYIPKGEGHRHRPLGIPTFEDKVLQRAVTMVLEAVYEQDFKDFSYGFRPGRSAHQALDQLRQGLMTVGGGWVVDVDIQGFFDSLDHRHMQHLLAQRVRDGVIRRAVGKWLNAGVQRDGSVQRARTGSPQGGVISPLLANIYLHHVIDCWYVEAVKPRLHGRSFLIRYADDLVIVCEREEDARRIMEVLPKRLGKHGLKLHPDKTRLVPFGQPGRNSGGKGRDRHGGGPETFTFLGFTHYWARSRKGKWVIKQRTAKSRFSRSVTAASQWCRRNRHLPVAVQHRILSRKLRGHYNYYGISGNSEALGRLRTAVMRAWRKWLDRRSQKRRMPWARFQRLLQRYPLPPPIAVHSAYRLAANP